MSGAIKAIETQYKGYNFRSRLEARYAYMLDLLAIEYEYEKEGYTLPSGEYLPDFWLPGVKMWAEVKGTNPTKEEYRLAEELAAATGSFVIFMVGTPCNEPYTVVCGDGTWFDVIITNHHDYPQNENRFYTCPADYERFMDTETACEAAKSARFEHGEKPIMFKIPYHYRNELIPQGSPYYAMEVEF